MRKIWLTPVLALGALFGSAAVAQEPLPDAPSATISPQWKVQPGAKIDLSYPAPKYKDDFNYYRLAPMPKEFADKPGGIVGRSIEFFDSHSPKGDTMFDFAVETKLGHGFSLVAGTVDNNNTGQQAALKQTVRTMTGLPDSDTRDLRRALSNGMPYNSSRGNDGVAIGIRFHIGGK